jgi:hypothetical protein
MFRTRCCWWSEGVVALRKCSAEREGNTTLEHASTFSPSSTSTPGLAFYIFCIYFW